MLSHGWVRASLPSGSTQQQRWGLQASGSHAQDSASLTTGVSTSAQQALVIDRAVLPLSASNIGFPSAV